MQQSWTFQAVPVYEQVQELWALQRHAARHWQVLSLTAAVLHLLQRCRVYARQNQPLQLPTDLVSGLLAWAQQDAECFG